MRRPVDLSSGPRRAQYERFSAFRNPMVGVTAHVDITLLRARTQREGWPFFLTLLYCAIGAANAVPELRRRIVAGEVVEYDACLSSHTVALPDGSYTYCELDCSMPFAQFLPYATAQVERAKQSSGLDDGEEPERLFFVSSLPWLSFTGLSLPVAEPPESNPAITFGKFFAQGDRLLLPVNLTVHHGLADGLHIARFFEGFQSRLEQVDAL